MKVYILVYNNHRFGAFRDIEECEALLNELKQLQNLFHGETSRQTERRLKEIIANYHEQGSTENDINDLMEEIFLSTHYLPNGDRGTHTYITSYELRQLFNESRQTIKKHGDQDKDNMIGIYQIRNILDGKLYIGSSIELKKRKDKHFYRLKNNKHENQHLQNAVNKHGIENFIFEILEEFKDYNLLLLQEQKYLDELKPEYNICKFAGHTLGYKHSPEMRKKISDIVKSKMTPEVKEKIRLSKVGNSYKISDEQRKKRSDNILGEKNYFFGKTGVNSPSAKFTEEQVRQIREEYEMNKCSFRSLARKYSTSHNTISNIIKRISWKDTK